MKTKLALALVVVAVLATGIIVKRPDLLPGHDGSWVVRRTQKQGTLRAFSATAKTQVSCQDKTVLSDVKITHMPPNKCRMEYTSEPLKGVIVGNDGKRNWRYDPRTKRLVVSSGPGCGAGNKMNLLLAAHRVGLAGRTQIAGRDAYSLVVRPRNSWRIKKRLWVDRSAFVVLGQEDYDSHGRLQSSTRFTSIRFAKNFPDRLFQVPADVEATVAHRAIGESMSLDKLSRAVGFTVRVPGYVPRGYKLDAYRLYECPCDCPHDSAYIRYTDGLESISIFESKTGSGCSAQAGCDKKAGPMGTCNVRRADRGEIVSVQKDGISFVVVGDLDSHELKKTAESLR